MSAKPSSGGGTRHPRATRRSRFDTDLAENTDQVNLVDQIRNATQRAASMTDDAVNADEASEERLAAYDSQVMR